MENGQIRRTISRPVMKVKLHFPEEEYGFSEVEVEVASIDEARRLYHASKPSKLPLGDELLANGGLDAKEWRNTLDGYLSLGTMPSEVYERMSRIQKEFIQEIKKSIKRVSPPTEPRVRLELTQE